MRIFDDSCETTKVKKFCLHTVYCKYGPRSGTNMLGPKKAWAARGAPKVALSSTPVLQNTNYKVATFWWRLEASSEKEYGEKN
jgi:hypothetical protein